MDDDRPPSTCRSFVQHEANFKARLNKTKKKRLSARDLLHACIKLVDHYDSRDLPDISPEDHAKSVMPILNIINPQDETFLTQVLYGCCRYKEFLHILVEKLFSSKSPNVQCVDKTLYTVLGYLVFMRLEELTFDNFRKFVLSQHPQRLLPFMQFVFSQEDLFNSCKPEWIKIYDVEYVDTIIKKLADWSEEVGQLTRRLEDKIVVIKKEEKRSTAIKPFNLSIAQKKYAVTAENKEEQVKPFKAKPPPHWKKGPTPSEKALDAVRRESREKLAKFYSDPKNQPFHLHSLERPSKFVALKEQIEAARRLENEYIPPKARPCPEHPTTEVKLTTTAVLREHAMYQKKLDEERQRVQAFEVELRDDTKFKQWQEEMKTRDQIQEEVYKKFRKAAVDASDEAAVLAKEAKVQEKREMVKKVKDETQKLEALKEEFIVNMELFNRLRRENVIEGQKAAKAAIVKVAETKKERAREIQAETEKLAVLTANERAADLAKKKELIAQLHTLELESTHLMKKFDRNTTGQHGLLTEMSITELQEQLVFVKQAIKKEEEYRRVRISSSKDEQMNKLLEKSAFVKKMRELSRVQRIAKKD